MKIIYQSINKMITYQKYVGNSPCIYKLSFPDGCFYIGSTLNYRQRISGYKSSFKNSIGSVNKLIAAHWIKFGEVNISIIEVLQNAIGIKSVEDKYIKLNWGNKKCLNRSKSAFNNTGLVKIK